MGIRCADHATPSTRKSRHYFADSGGRSLGIVRLRTKATEFFFFCLKYHGMKANNWFGVKVLFILDLSTTCFSFRHFPQKGHDIRDWGSASIHDRWRSQQSVSAYSLINWNNWTLLALGTKKGVWGQLAKENIGMWEEEIAELCRETNIDERRNLCAWPNVIRAMKWMVRCVGYAAHM
jgi:hypothetical protein